MKKLRAVPTAVDPEAQAGADENDSSPASFLPDRLDAVSVPGPVQAPDAPPQAMGPPAPELELPDQKSKLEGIYKSVAQTDPARAAEVLAMSKRLGEPEAFIDKNLDHVKRVQSQPSPSLFAQIEKEYPGTSQFLSVPQNMAVAHDDIPNVKDHEDTVKAAADKFSMLDAAKAGYQSSVIGLMKRGQLPDISLPENAHFVDSVISQAAQLAMDFPVMLAGGAAGGVAGASAGAVGGAMVGSIPGAALGATVGAAAGTAAGGFAAPAAIRTALIDHYQKGDIKSAHELFDRTLAIMGSAAKEGTIGVLTAGMGSLAAKPFAGAAAKAIAKATAEVGTMTTAPALAEGRLPTARELAEGAVMVGGMHAVGHVLSHPGLEEQKAAEAKNFYTALGATAEAAKLRERMPEAHQALIKELTKDSPVENIYIPVEAAVEYFQSKNLPPEAVMDELGVRDSFEEAKATGGDVKVPLATWTDKVVGTEHYQGLADNVKFHPDDMTFKEVTDKKAAIEAEMKAVAEMRALEGQDGKVPEIAPAQSGTKVFDAIQKQLEAAGLSKQELEFNPKIHEAFFTTLGKHLGVAPEELAKRYPLKINGVEGLKPDVPMAGGFRQDVLEQIKFDIEQGGAEKGALLRDGEGNVTGRTGTVSTYPEYFKNKGYSKKATLTAIEKHLNGEKLTDRQAEIVKDLYASSGYDQAARKEVAEPFLQSAAPKRGSAIEYLKSKWAGLPPEEKASLFAHDPVTHTLNARAFEKLPPDPAKPMVGHVSVEGIKFINDKFGHDAADDLYRYIGQALMKADPEAAKVGGDFAVRVKDQAGLDELIEKVQGELPRTMNLDGKTVSSEGFRLTGMAGKDLAAAAKAHGKGKEALELAGERSKRGEMPKGFEERSGETAEPAAHEKAPLHEDIGKHVAADDEAAFKKIHQTETGLLTYDAFKQLPEAKLQGSLDLNGIKEINDKFGYEQGNDVLAEFETVVKLVADEMGFEPDVAHKSGDEYLTQHDDGEKLRAFWIAVRDKIGTLKHEGFNKDGEPEIVPLTISVGLDRTKEHAEQRLQEAKQESKAGAGNLSERRSSVRTWLDTGAEGGGHEEGSGSGSTFEQAPAEGQGQLNQPGEQGPRGRIRIGPTDFNIDLLQNADKSTFLHETGHYFLEVLGHVAQDEGAPEHIKQDYKTLLDWLGVESKDQIGVEQHEKFARGFEQYLMEGKAPSTSLQRAFDRFRRWLTSIYRDLRGLKVNLTDDVRGVMDRMLASEDEVALAQRAVGYTGGEIPGVTPEVAAKVRELQAQARDIAERQLLGEQMKELKTSHKEFLRSERKRLTAEAEDAIRKEPVFAAIGDLNESSGRKDAVSRAQRYLKAIEKGQGAEAEFDAQAEVHGFASGDHLAKSIVEAQESGAFEKSVKSRVEEGMSQYADLKDTAQIRELALRAIHNEKSLELLALEREAMDGLIQKTLLNNEISRRRRIEARLEAAEIQGQAARILGGKPYKDATNEKPYITAERNAAVKAAKALAKGDYEAASEAKRQQALNHALASEAMKNKREADKALSQLEKFTGRGQDLMKAPYGFVRQVDQLLSRFGLEEERREDAATLSQIARDMAAAGEDPAEIANRTGYRLDDRGQWVQETLPDFVKRVNDNYYGLVLPDSVMTGASKPYKELTIHELQDLRDAVKAVAQTGKTYQRFLGEFKTEDVRQAAKLLRIGIEKEVGTPYADSLQVGSSHRSRFGEKMDALLKLPDFVIPDLVNTLTLCEYLDGGKEGAAKEFIYRPLKHAEDRKLARYGEMTKAVNDLFAKYFTPKELASYKDRREMQPALGRYMTREEILAVALNWGNEGNRDRIRQGFKIDDAKVGQVLDTLTKKEWDFVQDVWNHLDGYWPEISALEMKVRGVEPKRVEHAEVVTKHGTYAGGYYPIAYDFDKSADAYRDAEQKNALYKQYSATAAHTDTGHTQSRVNGVARPVRLSMDVLFNHLENVVHDLEYRPAVIDVNRFLKQTDTKAAIVNAVGLKGYSSLENWLKAAASDQGETLNLADRAFRWFRFNATFATLGLSLKPIFVHGPGNIANAMWEMGPTKAISAMKDFMMSPVETKEFVEEKSVRMAQRSKMRDRDMMDMSKKWLGNESAIRNFAFMTYRIVDESVAFPVWMKTYKTALAEHGEAKAIDIADEAVTRTLGSGSILDQVGAQRGPETKKILTMMFSWASMMFNRAWLSGKLAGLDYKEGNTGAAIATVAKMAAYGWFAQAAGEALWEALANNSQSGSTDEEHRRMVAAFVKQPFAYLWIGRDIGGYVIDQATGAHGSGYHVSPLENSIESILKPFGQAAHIAFSDNAHADQRFGESVAKSATTMMGVPNQLNKVMFNFLDWSQGQGELTWRDLLSRRTKH